MLIDENKMRKSFRPKQVITGYKNNNICLQYIHDSSSLKQIFDKNLTNINNL